MKVTSFETAKKDRINVKHGQTTIQHIMIMTYYVVRVLWKHPTCDETNRACVVGVSRSPAANRSRVFFFYIPEWLTMANMLNLHDDKSKCPHSQKK